MQVDTHRPHDLNRRSFLARAGLGLAGTAVLPLPLGAEEPAASPSTRATILGYSACSWNLREASPKVFQVARQIGLNGVQLDVGAPGGFRVFTPAEREKFKSASREAGVALSSLAIGCLNQFPLKSDRRAPDWVRDGITAAKDFGVKVLLLAFFGEGEIQNRAEADRVADILKEIGPFAQENDVVIGLENTLSARDSLRIIERSGSPAVKVYYDVGNARHWGHDGPAELRSLGNDMVCEVHFKDGTESYGDAYLGEGKVDWPAVAGALHAIEYQGWITLEPKCTDLIPDMKKNLAFARSLMA